MQSTHSETIEPDHDRRFAGLLVRVRAAMYDFMLFAVAVVVVLSLATAWDSDIVSRIVGGVGMAAIVLYEPVMVSMTGGTIGHIITNLRVVDDRSHGNPGLLKALTRFVIKLVLGWFSFITLMASSRRRAVHDILTQTTVQTRVASRIRAGEFVAPAAAPDDRVMPSGLWRALGIVLYSASAFVLLSLTVPAALFSGVVSKACIDGGRCASHENFVFGVLGLAWIVSLFVIVALGWRGNLWGFRARRLVETS